MSAEKRSVSAPADLFARADQRKAQLGYATFSDYIQALMHADTLGGGSHLRDELPRLDGPKIPPVPPSQTETSYHRKRKK